MSTRTPIRRLIVTVLTMACVLAAWPSSAAPPGASAGRAGQLERAAVDLAIRLGAVPVRDGELSDPTRYCPRDRLAVSWAPPAGAFRFGAYIPPLGPAPGPTTTSVNGVVTCRGWPRPRHLSGAGPLDDLAPYRPQTTCSPSAKPGVVGFRNLVLAAYPATASWGISRACSIGGTSEHKEGRAWDWASR